jgi:hypothetical protein
VRDGLVAGSAAPGEDNHAQSENRGLPTESAFASTDPVNHALLADKMR